MSKVYDIAFKIAGKLSSNFSSTFNKGKATVAGMRDSLATLNAKAANLDGLVRSRKAVANSARDYIRAKANVEALGKAMSATQNPSKKMVSEFNRAKIALDRAKRSLDQNRVSLRELDVRMGTTGTNLKTLIDRQNALARSADKARAAQQRMAAVNSNIDKAKGVQDKIQETKASSTSALVGIGATVAATVGAPVKQAMNFEDQQAELRKFSDDYQKVFDGIKSLSLQYAKSTEDMTAMAANAFQSGIAKTADDALKLVEIQNQMAIAFGMTGEEVGSYFADIQSKMGLTVDQSQEMFDIVNQIGNVTSAKAKDIVEVLARTGGAVRGLTALSEKQVAALAGAFRSASVSSETASTSMMSFINALSAGAGATKGQREGLAKLGIDAEKMASMMTAGPEFAVQAIQDVFKRINKLSESQKSSVIGAIFGNEAGVKAAVATLAKQTEILGGNLDMITDPAKYAGSMLKEFKARADTTSNSLEIAGNAVQLVAGGIGLALLPAVRESADAFVENSASVIRWVDENQELIKTAMKVSGAIFGSVAAFHALRLAGALVAGPIVSAYKGFLMLQKGLVMLRNSTVLATAASKAHAVAVGAWNLVVATATSTVKVVRSAMLLLNVAMRANPVGFVVSAFSLLVGAGLALANNWDEIKAKAQELWASFSEKFPNLSALVSGAFTSIGNVVQGGKAIFEGLADWVSGTFLGKWGAAWSRVREGMIGVFANLAGSIKAPINSVIALVNDTLAKLNALSIKLPSALGGGTIGFNVPEIPQLAEGGIASSPTLAMIGEGREPEAVVPLSKLSSMLSSGMGKGFGVGDSTSTSTVVNFSPVINITGGGADTYADVKRALDEGRRSFEREFDQLMRNRSRLSFA